MSNELTVIVGLYTNFSAMDLKEADLLSQLQLHNDYFKKMTDLIPARYYFEQEPQHGVTKGSGKYSHNAKENAPKQQLKDKLLQKKNKTTSGKRQRLDPGQQRSVTQIQQDMDQDPLAASSSSKQWRVRSEDESESDAMGTGLEDLSDDDDDGGSEDEKDSKSESKASRIKPMSVESVTSSATIDELREKVRRRIEELRTKRKAKPSPAEEAVIPKKMAKKEAEKEKKKKAEAYKAIKASKAQQEVMDKAAAKKKVVSGDKAIEASKAQQEVQEKAASKKKVVNGDKVPKAPQEVLEKAAAKKKVVNGDMDSSGSDGSGADSDADANNERTKKAAKTKKGKKKGGGGKGAVEEKAVSFSAFDFAENEQEKPQKRKRKKLTEPRGSRDFTRLIKKAELKQQKMKDLKAKDPDKALEAETEDKWKNVIDRAQGVKIKDDVELLKKSMKRKEQRKKASKKKWEERETRLDEKKKHKDTKRRQNIKSKTDARKSKKVKRLQGKGKLLLQD